MYVDEIETKRSLQTVNYMYVHYEKRKPAHLKTFFFEINKGLFSHKKEVNKFVIWNPHFLRVILGKNKD